jgi:hypothetical protein
MLFSKRWGLHDRSAALPTRSSVVLQPLAWLRCMSPELAHRVDSLRCEGSDAIEAEADMPRASGAGRSDENDPKEMAVHAADMPMRPGLDWSFSCYPWNLAGVLKRERPERENADIFVQCVRRPLRGTNLDKPAPSEFWRNSRHTL